MSLSIYSFILFALFVCAYGRRGGISSVYSSPKHKRGDLGIPRSMLPVERESYDSNGRRGPSRRRPHPPEVVTMRSRRKHADTGSVVEKIDSLAKQGQSIYRTLFRKAKVMKSSAFEALLLKATWPDDSRVSPVLLQELIKHSIPAFKRSRFPEDDPYHMTTHKLWMKMCEPDWRTVVKALYILQAVSRESTARACRLFAGAIRGLARERVPKHPGHRYFDTSLIAAVEDQSARGLVLSYAAYVLHRARFFSGRFIELEEFEGDGGNFAVVKRAQQCVSMGLSVPIPSRRAATPLTASLTQLMALDMIDLWTLLSARVQELLEKDAISDDELQLLSFYRDTLKQVESHIATSRKVCNQYRLKLPSEEMKVDQEKLERRIRQLQDSEAEVCSDE